jgi:peroxiredoxin (alkyl hydroperoxide reductase subunit C)
VAFARRHAEFESLGCALVGLSVDSLYSHIAWTRSIEQVFGVTIPFPIIDDLSMQISSLYGMIQPAESHTSAIRAAFFIDPEGLLRALVYYPPSAGRSIEELLRLVQALQAGDREDAATPEGWQPGDSLVLPAPKTTQAAQERVLTAKNQGLECLDWYYCRKTAAGPTKKAAA